MRVDLGPDEEPEIGLIALIDCIFFLLMFFMVATTFKQQEQLKKTKELPIVLPRSSAVLAPAPPATATGEPLVILIDRAGRVSIEGQALTPQALHDRLRLEGQKDPKPGVRIEADQRTAYQHLVTVVDLCQFEGLRELSLRTRP